MDWQLFMDWIVLLPLLSGALLVLSPFLLFPRTLAEMIDLLRSGSAIPVKFRKRFIISAAGCVLGMAGLMATLSWLAGYPAIFIFAMVLFPFIGLLPESYLHRLRRHEALVTVAYAVVVALVIFWFAFP
jgi:hypothetical protein